MGTVVNFLHLPASERRLVVRALILVVTYRLALHLVSPSRIRELAACPKNLSASLAAFEPGRVAWAVQATARRVPGATCLTQALALHRLLAKAGHDAEILIGVAKGAKGGIDSHAWVVCHGTVLAVEGEDPGRFEPILSLGAGRP